MDLQFEMGKYDENQYRILPMYKCNYLDNAETAIKSGSSMKYPRAETWEMLGTLQRME